MFKKILLLITLCSFLFGANQNFIDKDKAFIVESQEYKEKISLNIELAKDIYIYDETLKVFIGKQEITKKLSIQKPIEYHGFVVHFDKIIVDVPRQMISDKINLEFQGCSTAGVCYMPMTKTFDFLNKQQTAKNEISSKNETDVIAQTLKDGNIFLILATFFGFGLLLSLTPCVFPMIPILSSIIISHSKHGDLSKISASKGFILSLIYVFSMSIAYTIAGILAGVFGASIPAMLQNPTVIIVFSGVFVALAFSMFGYFKLEIPQSWQTKLHKTTNKESKKGYTGVAIMGFLSALIVGPCVAPPLAGALVYIGQTGDAFLGGIALFVMSFGMGMPLLLVGAGAGKYMPKPGGWMDAVSKAFGVVMLGIAIYMLSRIISDTITQILWMSLFAGSGIYLMTKKQKVLKILSVAAFGVSMFFAINFFTNNNDNNLKFIYIKNIKQLEAKLQNSNKPIMLDFWATWCANCKKLEKDTFVNADVKKELKKYTLLKIDVTKNSKEDKELQKKFNIFGPPALIFFNKNGEEEKNKRIVGFKNHKEFLEIIK